ncbi:FBX11-like protein [Mya arenaria]|uniref:FBX11-like protein n=1 Tax=Mya arenaria TaxID=6604 RepID=A0ABY7D7U1_MYAAR|nr:FBX11-like protein [Mya arenaria]
MFLDLNMERKRPIFELKKQWEENKDLKAVIVDMSKDGSPDQAINPDLEDDVKRWLITGLALHNVISPALRPFVEHIALKEYAKYQASDNIHAQTFLNYLKDYPPTKKKLNYENINNNVQHRKDFKKYDFQVQHAADFSKLFLQTHLAHYSGFDDSCDSSALLAIIGNMDGFSTIFKKAADELRKDVRNPWAHANFDEWDVLKYQRIHFLSGTTLGIDILTCFNEKTKALAKYIIGLETMTYENCEACSNALDKITVRLDNTFRSLESNQKALLKKTSFLAAKVEHNSENIAELRSEINETTERVACTEIKLSDATENIQTVKDDLETLKDKVFTNKLRVGDTGKKETDTTKGITPFFNVPNRLYDFTGRAAEKETLARRFQSKGAVSCMQIICGLGGTGKTSLAVEYAWEYANYYQKHVFSINAECEETFCNAIQCLAFDIETVGKNVKETLYKTTKWLTSLKHRWLLLIDNMDTDDISGVLKEFLFDARIRNSNAHIIITSRRNADDAEETFQVEKDDCLSLDVFTQEESILLLEKRTALNVDDDAESVIGIVNELGRHPLALKQAAIYIRGLKKHGCSYRTYFEKLKHKRLNVLKRLEGTKQDYRLAVQTTWEINFEYIANHSDEFGLKETTMKFLWASSFLHGDDIPKELIDVLMSSKGDPNSTEDAEYDIDAMQIMETLSRFSLFQTQKSENANIVCKAFEKCAKPVEVLQQCSETETLKRGTLHLWHRLANHANEVKRHILNIFRNNEQFKNVVFREETAILLHNSAVYHSLYQRHNEALADQDLMVKIISSSTDISIDVCRKLSSIRIPLMPKDKNKIENAIATGLDVSLECKTGLSEADSTKLNDIGNDAFKKGQHHDAIRIYSEVIRGSMDDEQVTRAYANRSAANLNIMDFHKALDDANACIERDRKYWKAYCRKALAISNLIKLKQIPAEFESIGLAAAASAGVLNQGCLNLQAMRIEYPVIRYKVIENLNMLGEEMASLENMSFTTLLLKTGIYNFGKHFPTKSVQIIGIEQDVKLTSPFTIPLFWPAGTSFKSFGYIKPASIYVHFENVEFGSESAEVCVGQLVTATFVSCRFSNGVKACEAFPNCDGKVGCRNTNKTECVYMFKLNEVDIVSSGKSGSPGIVVMNGGKTILQKCTINRCGGGGTLCDGIDSFMKIENCTIENNRQAGIESRNGGKVEVDKCIIRGNQLHGVAIGPKAIGEIRNSDIRNNGSEGIWLGGAEEYVDKLRLIATTNSENGSSAKITGNSIHSNGQSGISLSGGSYLIESNRISNNWMWGILLQTRSSAFITKNDVFGNKCGGVYIGVNFSAVVTLDGNTIRDHSGPSLRALRHDFENIHLNTKANSKTVKQLKSEGMIDDESTKFSNPPILTSRNVMRDNDTGCQNPQEVFKEAGSCSYCQITNVPLKQCSSCKKIAYCGRECQSAHWKKHKPICQIIVKNYTVRITMKDTEDTKDVHGWNRYSKQEMLRLRYDSHLPGIGEGRSPDRNSTKRFIVKIQSGREYKAYDPKTKLMLYDQSVSLDILVRDSKLYHLVNECGVLAATQFTTKKIFCWASFQDQGGILCIDTSELPPWQTW